MGTKRLDIAKKQHRERGQLAHRQKLGLLEKHKDYVLRAKDYHSKQNRLKTLEGKAALRNQDEFYFGMVRGKTKNGVHIQSAPGTEALPHDTVQLLKSQDLKYIHTLRSKEQKKIAKLQQDLGVIAGAGDLDEEELQLLTQPPAHTAASRPSPASSSSQPSSSKHTYFTEEVSDLKDPSSIKHLKAPSSKSKGKAKMHAADAEHRDSIVQELRARLERDAALARVERDVQVQKNLMGKGVAKQLVGRRSTQEEDDDEFNDDDAMGRGDQQAKQRSKLLPKPQQGIRTGARVYKFKMERQR